MAPDADGLRAAVEALRAGGVVVFPTETTYGIAADATNARAVRRVSRLKGRSTAKTPPLIVASVAQARRLCRLSPALLRLARSHWPGPLTVVAPVRPRAGLAGDVVRADGTVAVRVSSHPTARALARRLGHPIVATSANRAGKPAARSLASARRAFTGYAPVPDAWLDGGTLPRRRPSTIVAERGGRLVVLRQGAVRVRKTMRE